MLYNLYNDANTALADVEAIDTEIAPAFNNYVYVIVLKEFNYKFGLELAKDGPPLDDVSILSLLRNPLSTAVKICRVFADEEDAKRWCGFANMQVVPEKTNPVIDALMKHHGTRNVLTKITIDQNFQPTMTTIIKCYSYEKQELHGLLLTDK